MARLLGALAVLLLCAACGQVELKTADDVPPPVQVDVPTTSTAPTSVPPTGPCKVEEHVSPPATETTPPPAVTPTNSAGPDVAPHHAENNRWKQRKPLTVKGVQTGRDTIAKIRPVLERVCASGDFSADTTKKALAELKPLVEQFSGLATGVLFNITVTNGPTERVTCVFGDLVPGMLRIFVNGTDGEGSCYTPKTH